MYIDQRVNWWELGSIAESLVHMAYVAHNTNENAHHHSVNPTFLIFFKKTASFEMRFFTFPKRKSNCSCVKITRQWFQRRQALCARQWCITVICFFYNRLASQRYSPHELTLYRLLRLKRRWIELPQLYKRVPHPLNFIWFLMPDELYFSPHEFPSCTFQSAAASTLRTL